jgi:hypothetical protein
MVEKWAPARVAKVDNIEGCAGRILSPRGAHHRIFTMFCQAPPEGLPQCNCPPAWRPCPRTALVRPRSRAWQTCACSSQGGERTSSEAALPRRHALLMAAAVAAASTCTQGRPAAAFTPPPPGAFLANVLCQELFLGAGRSRGGHLC